jgi:hypothetical protein
MEVIKCSQCHLMNPPTAFRCRRCGHVVGIPEPDRVPGPRERSNGVSSWLYTLLALALVVAAAAYIYQGFEKSFSQVQANEAKRTAKQVNTQPPALSRSQFEKQQAGHYGTAIQNSNGLAQSQKHVDEVEKLMQNPPK